MSPRKLTRSDKKYAAEFQSELYRNVVIILLLIFLKESLKSLMQYKN